MVFSIHRAAWMLAAFFLGQAVGQAEFAGDIRPLLERYCHDCHGNKRAKAEVNLEAGGDAPGVFGGRRPGGGA